MNFESPKKHYKAILESGIYTITTNSGLPVTRFNPISHIIKMQPFTNRTLDLTVEQFLDLGELFQTIIRHHLGNG